MVRDLTMAYGSFVLLRGIDFTIRRGDIFVIMGGSGLRQEHADAPDDRPEAPGAGAGAVRRRRASGRRRRRSASS